MAQTLLITRESGYRNIEKDQEMSTSLKGWLATDNETESNGNAGRGKRTLASDSETESDDNIQLGVESQRRQRNRSNQNIVKRILFSPDKPQDNVHQDSLVEVAKKYQNYMRFMPTPRCRITEQIEAVSWENVAEALKKWCGQTLHYLTYKLCKQWDGARVGSEDEEKPLHAIINWRDAEDTIWHIEQIHRLFTSPSHLAMLWLGDPQFNTFVDEAVIKIL